MEDRKLTMEERIERVETRLAVLSERVKWTLWVSTCALVLIGASLGLHIPGVP